MRTLVLVLAVTLAFGAGPVTEKQLLEAQRDPGSWLHYGRNYAAWRYSEQTGINASNVARLAPRWIYQTGVNGKFETTPIVHGGLMYITAPSNHSYALDLATGRPIWHHYKPVPRGVNVCCGQVNRGFATPCTR